jgi:hypothetical protein
LEIHRASPSGMQAMISCAPMSTPAAWGVTWCPPWDDRMRVRLLSLLIRRTRDREPCWSATR